MSSRKESSDVVLAIDQGTTGTKALLLDSELRVLSEASHEFPQHFPSPGWVEHEVEDIYASVRRSVTAALKTAGIDARRIAAIGITNQRETTLIWEKDGGRPIHRAIVWQDRRTADTCEDLKAQGMESIIRRKTGLLLDPYFSGTKVKWLLDHVEGARKAAEANQLQFGTVDTYLVWRMTGERVHVTDVSNASRTLLMNLETCRWDEDLLEILGIPPSLLPSIQDNDKIFGHTRGVDFLPDGIPIASLLGDQQSALFGEACFEPGEAKCTYGTGAFLVLNTGEEMVSSRSGMLSTTAWRMDATTTYAMEGSSFIAGAIIQWLRDGLGMIQGSSEVEDLARRVDSSDGVVLVPSLTGMGAPHWNPGARGLICGITRGTTAAHIARAALEGIAFQIHDILEAMTRDRGRPIRQLKVDGGAAENDLLMQFQADLLGVDVVRPQMTSTTSLGAALQAGLTIGMFPSLEAIRKVWKEGRRFTPRMPPAAVREALESWNLAVRRASLASP
jgi:glycerol kinase